MIRYSTIDVHMLPNIQKLQKKIDLIPSILRKINETDVWVTPYDKYMILESVHTSVEFPKYLLYVYHGECTHETCILSYKKSRINAVSGMHRYISGIISRHHCTYG